MRPESNLTRDGQRALAEAQSAVTAFGAVAYAVVSTELGVQLVGQDGKELVLKELKCCKDDETSRLIAHVLSAAGFGSFEALYADARRAETMTLTRDASRGLVNITVRRSSKV